MTLADTGCGMAQKIADRAFEPFFTTKAKGTGLGLPVVKEMVLAHGGTIHHEPLEPHGTVFLIDVPVNGPGGS